MFAFDVDLNRRRQLILRSQTQDFDMKSLNLKDKFVLQSMEPFLDKLVDITDMPSIVFRAIDQCIFYRIHSRTTNMHEPAKLSRDKSDKHIRYVRETFNRRNENNAHDDRSRTNLFFLPLSVCLISEKENKKIITKKD